MRIRGLSSGSGCGWMLAGLMGLGALGCGSAPAEQERPGQGASALETGGVVVNECSSGTSGWIELYNSGSTTADLGSDPTSCWFVDDTNGGGKPKQLAHGNVNHATGSTTCAGTGLGEQCALVAPGERVWVQYAYVNSKSNDECRLLTSAQSGGNCSNSYVDLGVGGPTSSSAVGQCFGRSADGSTWASGAIACTPDGGSNGSPSCPTFGQACDDGNACTSGETIDATCQCTGGTPLSCDDGNECTTDTCDPSAGCSQQNASDGTTCSSGTCQAGQCVGSPGQSTPVVVINEFSPGNGGFVELYNTGDTPADVGGYQIDDVESGGSKPKTIAAGTTIAPKSYLVISYSGINTASADEVRFVDQAGTGVAGPGDSTSNFYAGSSIAGQCFGRQPDGGAWASAALSCSQGQSNGGGGAACEVGAACDDGNACTVGEVFQADCSCGGGSSPSCDDADPCTADACESATGCTHSAVTDGTQCGTGLVCQAGQCTPGTTTGAVLVSMGSPGVVLLRGTVVTPDSAFAGEVLVEGDVITCVDVNCSTAAQTGTPSVVETNGIILPGLIDAHNHILFDIFDESDWTPPKVYENHNQWPSDARYSAMVDAKQYLNGEYSSPVSVGCEMNKYGELKGLIAGTTSIAGSANPANKACYGSLARTIDQSPNDLPGDKIQAATLFPSTSAADSVCNNIASDKTDAYVIHVGEGVDQSSLNEFANLYTVPTNDGCLHAPETTIVHGTAFGAPEFASMAAAGMSLVWSPRSNVFLYGAGTDYTKTTNIPLALSHGINVALAPDWSIGGSQNLLDELRFANTVDDSAFGNVLTPQALTRMVTIQAAKAIGLDHLLGSIEVGKKADLFVIGGDGNAPYDALLASRPRDVRLVMVNGVPLYGDSQLSALGPADPGCEALDVCSASKFVCVAEPGGTSTNKLGQTLGDIVNVLSTELSSYDAMDLSAWDFSPIAPLVKCD